jgi:hypothetical protein
MVSMIEGADDLPVNDEDMAADAGVDTAKPTEGAGSPPPFETVPLFQVVAVTAAGGQIVDVDLQWSTAVANPQLAAQVLDTFRAHLNNTMRVFGMMQRLPQPQA